MTIINREKERVQSTCTVEELAEAIKSLNVASIPRENREKAIIERLNHVMLATTTDPKERDKPAYRQAETVSRLMPDIK